MKKVSRRFNFNDMDIEYKAFGRNYYSAAFFRMKVDVPSPLIPIDDIPDASFALYFHEYIHFIQDISTIYGLMNINNLVYYIHDIASRISKQGATYFDIPVPLPNDKTDFGYVNHLLMPFYKGTAISPMRARITITGFSEVMTQWGPESGQIIPCIMVTATDKMQDSTPFEFRLGGNHITEGMAYLCEQHVYYDLLKGQDIEFKANEYPYHVVQKLAAFVYPEIAEERQLLIAACDAALMTYNPGVSFMQVLFHLKQLKFAENGYDISSLYRTTATLLKGSHPDIQIMSDMARDLIKKNFKVEYFEGNNEWIDLVFERITALRTQNPSFIHAILVPGDLKKNIDFRVLLAYIGSPMVVNGFNEGTFSIPAGFDTSRLHLGLFWAINQILRVFTNSKPIPCELKAHCKESEVFDPLIVVDERCDKNPWSRCKDANLCPFGAMWKHWGLSAFEPKINTESN